MDIYTLARIKSRYPVDLDSAYSPRKYAADYLLQWQGSRHRNAWDRERYVLSEALTQPDTEVKTLAEQVFGTQVRGQKLQVMHEASLISARYELHHRVLNDLNHRLSGLQERISIAKMLDPWGQSKQLIDLEKLLINLESQENDERLAFWKDTLKVRQEMFTGVREYQSARQRATIFKDLEEGDANQA